MPRICGLVCSVGLQVHRASRKCKRNLRQPTEWAAATNLNNIARDASLDFHMGYVTHDFVEISIMNEGLMSFDTIWREKTWKYKKAYILLLFSFSRSMEIRTQEFPTMNPHPEKIYHSVTLRCAEFIRPP